MPVQARYPRHKKTYRSGFWARSRTSDGPFWT